VAVFVAFAWMIEAAEYLGLIETEAQDPESRAYRLAHHGLAVLKDELIGTPIEFLGERCVRKKTKGGDQVTIEARGGMVSREDLEEPLLDLGPGGGVSFLRYGKGLEVKIHARTEDGGAYDVNLILPPVRSG
jgi:hypothetical protein